MSNLHKDLIDSLQHLFVQTAHKSIGLLRVDCDEVGDSNGFYELDNRVGNLIELKDGELISTPIYPEEFYKREIKDQ